MPYTPIPTENTHLLHAETENGGVIEGREVEVYRPGKSTFTQTLLNMIGEIIGTGLLACPLAVARAGWAFGPIILLSFGLLTMYTLKILLRIIEKDRRLRNFTDIIGYAMGETGRRWAVFLYLLEVCGWIAMMVVLFSDSMNVVVPKYTSDQWKFLGMLVVVPAGFLPLRYLSFTSFLSVAATWSTVGLLVYIGLSRDHAPASIWDPAPTDFWPSQGWTYLGTTFGLFIAGFGGQSLTPILIHDMKHPEHADKVIHWSYALAMIVYLSIASLGYLMYGQDVSDEISRDIAQTPGFSPLASKFAVLMVAVTVIFKVPLSLRPFADIIFTQLHLHPSELAADVKADEDALLSSDSSTSSSCSTVTENSPHTPLQVLRVAHARREKTKAVLRPVLRMVLSVLALLTGIIFPSFGDLLSFMGAGLGTAMQVTLPLMAAVAVWGLKKRWVAMGVISGLAGVIGTVSVCVS